MNSTISDLARRLVADESGATAVEYGLIAMVVSVGIIASLVAWAEAANGLFTYIDEQVTGALAS